jgi:hypothetical protein
LDGLGGLAGAAVPAEEIGLDGPDFRMVEMGLGDDAGAAGGPIGFASEAERLVTQDFEDLNPLDGFKRDAVGAREAGRDKADAEGRGSWHGS